MTSMQGTYEFMSINLRSSLRGAKPHLHSPVDDLHSFYHTAQWAAAFNDGASGKRHSGDEIREFRDMIADRRDRREKAVYMVRDILRPESAEEYGPFFAQSLALLSPWWAKLAPMASNWRLEMRRADALEGEDKKKRLGLKFLVFAYRGVGEYFRLVHEHRESLQMAT